jgi:hypothetical protein
VSARRGPKSAGFWPAEKKLLRYDRHGDLVDIDDLDDACGATVATADGSGSRWLAQAPLARVAR